MTNLDYAWMNWLMGERLEVFIGGGYRPIAPARLHSPVKRAKDHLNL